MAYRIAANHLLTVRKSRVEREELTFSTFGEQLAGGLSDTAAPRPAEPDQALLEEEVKIGCTQGMLLCLDRDHRVAYILGEVFDLASDEAAIVLGVSPVTYRKRLSRARERLRASMSNHCGLAAIYGAHPSYTPPDRVLAEVRQTLGSRRLTLLGDVIGPRIL